MAKAQYIGVGGIARKDSGEYVGVSGIARKVKRGYIYALRRKLTYAGKKVTLGRNQPQDAITAVRSEFYGISN